MNEPRDPNAGTPSRVVFIRAPRLMTEDELRSALGGLAEDDPRWLAFNQLLDRSLARAALDASSPTLDPTKGTYPGGQMAALAELKDEWHRYRAAPLKPVTAAKPGKGGRK